MRYYVQVKEKTLLFLCQAIIIASKERFAIKSTFLFHQFRQNEKAFIDRKLGVPLYLKSAL